MYVCICICSHTCLMHCERQEVEESLSMSFGQVGVRIYGNHVRAGREGGREGGYLVSKRGGERGKVGKAFVSRHVRAYIYPTGLYGGRAGEFRTVYFLGLGGEIDYPFLTLTHILNVIRTHIPTLFFIFAWGCRFFSTGGN